MIACILCPWKTGFAGADSCKCLQISLIPDAEACATNYSTALDLTHTGAVTVTVTLQKRVYFTWPLCVPMTTGVPRVMHAANCPSDGQYRLCYYYGSAIETGVSVYIKQVSSIELVYAEMLGVDAKYSGISDSSAVLFGVDNVVESYSTFQVRVRLKDENGLACCEGTKVFLSLTKAGADASDKLWTSTTNANANKISLAGADGVAIFYDYRIRNTAGVNFYLTASAAAASLNIPATGSPTVGFIVRPGALNVDTNLASEYIVGAGADATSASLLDPIVVSARDWTGVTLVDLSTADGFTCEAMLETTGSGLDAAQGATWLAVRNSVTSTDLKPPTVQSGATNIVFNSGLASFTGVKVSMQAGLYFRIKFTLTQHAGSTGAAVVGAPTTAAFASQAAVNVPTSYTSVAYSTVFMISPAKMKVSWGASVTDYTASTFPIVVRSDGSAPTLPSVDAPNVDGLPSSLTISFLDGNGDTLANAACTNCVVARLVISTYDKSPKVVMRPMIITYNKRPKMIIRDLSLQP